MDQVWDYRQECLDADSHMDGCGPLRRVESPAEWLAYVISCMNPATLPEGKVQATLFLAVRESDNKVLIACEPDNTASRRTILANGGKYECTVHEPGADIDLERYWIVL